MASIAINIQQSKVLYQSGGVRIQRSMDNFLDQFQKGFNHFTKMERGSNFIIYITPSTVRAKTAAEAARQRIAEKKLPLVVIHKEMANRFIVTNES